MKLESLAKANLLSSKLQTAEEELKNLEKFLKSYEPLTPKEEENTPYVNDETPPIYVRTRGDAAGFQFRLEDPEIVLQLLQVIKLRKESQIAQFKWELESL